MPAWYNSASQLLFANQSILGKSLKIHWTTISLLSIISITIFVRCNSNPPPVSPTDTALPPLTSDDVVENNKGSQNFSSNSNSVDQPQGVDVIVFDITGGPVDFCDRLTLSLTEAQATYVLESCKNDSITGNLRNADIGTIEAWYKNLAGFSLSQERNLDSDDYLVSNITFSGAGSLTPNETQQQVIIDWLNGLFIRLRPQQVSASDTVSGAASADIGLCPEITRPAPIVANFGDPTLITLITPDTQSRCDVALETPPFGRFVARNGYLFYPTFNAEVQTIQVVRIGIDGIQQELEFTTIPINDTSRFSFTVSNDGNKIAWGHTNINADSTPHNSIHDAWLANIDGSEQQRLLNSVESPGTSFLEFIRFSLDQNTLYFALQPEGLRGSIFDFSGRYNSLYRVTRNDQLVQLIYNCPFPENAFCIGDVSHDASTFVYVDKVSQMINIVGTEGNPLARVEPPANNFIGQAVFSPQGTIAFISADLTEANEDTPARPNPGYITLIAPPYTTAANPILIDNSVATLWEWLDDNNLLYGAMDEFGNIGTNLVTRQGQVVPLSPNFALAILQ